MWGQGGRGGRHAAPTGAARRAAAADRVAADWAADPAEVPAPRAVGGEPSAPSSPAPSSDAGRAARAPGGEPTEPVAIIGGSAITLLAGRIRRRHTIADIEPPTTELAHTPPTTRSGPGADPPRAVGSRAVESRAADTPPGSAPPRGRRVPVTAAVIGTLVLAAVVAGAVISTRTDPVVAAPEPPTVPAQPAPPVAGAPVTSAPAPDRVEAYLGALRSADIPASRGGGPETEAADAICEQSRRGVPDAELARSLPAMLADVERQQAPTVVDLAKRYYCP